MNKKIIISILIPLFLIPNIVWGYNYPYDFIFLPTHIKINIKRSLEFLEKMEEIQKQKNQEQQEGETQQKEKQEEKHIKTDNSGKVMIRVSA
jgi:hypothetical protein